MPPSVYCLLSTDTYAWSLFPNSRCSYKFHTVPSIEQLVTSFFHISPAPSIPSLWWQQMNYSFSLLTPPDVIPPFTFSWLFGSGCPKRSQCSLPLPSCLGFTLREWLCVTSFSLTSISKDACWDLQCCSQICSFHRTFILYSCI